MSEENQVQEETKAEPKVYLYPDSEAAQKAAAESVRSRAYEVKHPDGRAAFVVDVNPLTAVGRAFTNWGHGAELIGSPERKPKDAAAIFEELQGLPEEEREKFLKMVKKNK